MPRDRMVHVWGALGSRSAVIFDIENDGDLDIITNEFNDGPMVLVSDLSASKKDLNFLKVRLIGTTSSTSGLGATVKITAGDDTYTQVNDGKSGYLSQSLMPLYFGLADHKKVKDIRVEWPSGKTQRIKKPRINTLLEIREPN
jgi:hypothetical protein